MKEFVPVVILITTSLDEEAQKIADKLLTQRKAACVNIISKVRSRFWWKGELDSADEALLIVKTKASFIDEIVSLVKEVHSYEVPEVIALPLIGGNRDYLNWMSDELRD
jgi:periplasmic divalent cation tolerance protein